MTIVFITCCKNHFLRVYVSIKNQPYDMTAKCNICKESHNKSCEFLHAIHDLDWGSFINQVDSWGGQGVSQMTFCKSGHERGGVKNTENFDHVVYGCPFGAFSFKSCLTY